MELKIWDFFGNLMPGKLKIVSAFSKIKEISFFGSSYQTSSYILVPSIYPIQQYYQKDSIIFKTRTKQEQPTRG